MRYCVKLTINLCWSLLNCLFHSTINLCKYQYVFLVTLCGEATDPANRTLLAIHSDYVNPVEETYYEGTRAYFRCELGNGRRTVHHPVVCQANGEWTQTARCEGRSSTVSN